MRRRKANQVCVSRGILAAYGATKTEANAKLEQQIDWALSGNELHIERRFNSMIVITRDPGGWQYKLVDLATSKHGMRYDSSCSQGPAEFKTVLQSARYHAAQNAWHQDANDADLLNAADMDADHVRLLADWINWQRRYAAAIAAGKDKNEAWNIASENPRLAIQ